ncbi:Uncharacterised protein [Pseudomonas aeruginosa]|nr:Uncharacterised protein [Pseudomonas aeruginosa]
MVIEILNFSVYMVWAMRYMTMSLVKKAMKIFHVEYMHQLVVISIF